MGKGLVNTWTGSDAPQGKLTSPAFTIERPYINFLIGGGRHPGRDVHQPAGRRAGRPHRDRHDTDAMNWANWDVRDLAGKSARHRDRRRRERRLGPHRHRPDRVRRPPRGQHPRLDRAARLRHDGPRTAGTARERPGHRVDRRSDRRPRRSSASRRPRRSLLAASSSGRSCAR